jgi:hypothetical protein
LLESAYVGAMRMLAVPLRATGVLPSFERAPRHSLRFWMASQFAIHDAAGLARLDVPWWTLRAIDVVERWIAARNGKVRVFEYGSGASTLWLARRCERVTSIENDTGFARATSALLARDNIEVRVIEPDRDVVTPRTPSGRRGYERCDFSAYVDSIASGGRYDLVVIDGRARAACLARAPEFLERGGIIVFDNSSRRRYRAALAACAGRVTRYRGCAPALPYPSETSLIEDLT